MTAAPARPAPIAAAPWATAIVDDAQAALIYGVLLVPQDFLKAHTHVVYLAHYLLFLPFLFNARDRAAFLFSPSFAKLLE